MKNKNADVSDNKKSVESVIKSSKKSSSVKKENLKNPKLQKNHRNKILIHQVMRADNIKLCTMKWM